MKHHDCYNNLLKDLVHWLYPPRCMMCSEIIPLHEARHFCATCKNNLDIITKPFCVVCGCPLPENGRCKSCTKFNWHFEYNRSIFVYENPILNIIHKIKYNNRKDYAEGLGLLMGELFSLYFDDNIDLIVSVPLYSLREKTRGFNQAELLAAGISNKTGIPLCHNLLKRIKQTEAQYNLTPKQRIANISGAFIKNTEIDIQNLNCLLVDDIYTTGSTLNECAKMLKGGNSGAIKTFTLSLAIKH